ncbi:MAG: cell division protein FtsL [Proteobacteria bacterium]|nr:cell division protein FtsL [Pseudomonadota bacterium]
MVRAFLALMLLLTVIVSALFVVDTRHQARQLFLQLESLAQARDMANSEWSRLQLEQATLADAGRVEQIAYEKLGMHTPDKIRILIVN